MTLSKPRLKLASQPEDSALLGSRRTDDQPTSLKLNTDKNPA